MKRIVVGLAGVLLLGSSLCQAGESDGEKAFHSYAKHVVGGVWKTTTAATKVVDNEMTLTGENTDLVHEYRPIADGKFIRFLATRDGQAGDFVSVLGVDPATDKFTWWGFGRWGVVQTTTTLMKERVWINARTNTNRQGSVVSVKDRITAVEKNENLTQRIEAIVDGEKKKIVTPDRTWTRHDGSIGSAPLAKNDEETEAVTGTKGLKAYRSFTEHVVGGDWSAEGEEGSHEYRWFAGKNFAQIVFDDPTSGTGIFGVDPTTDQATFWWFIDTGLVTVTLQIEKEGVWIMERNSPNEDGKRVTRKWRITKTGDNQSRTEQLEWTIDGVAQELSPPTIWQRSKK